MDRLQHPHLPGRDAGDPGRVVRGRGTRWRQPLAAVPQCDGPGAAADDPVHRHHLGIGSLQLFGEPYLFGGSRLGINGGADNQYSTLALYVYRLAFNSEHLGRAAAVAWVIFFIAVIVGAVNALVVRRLRKST